MANRKKKLSAIDDNAYWYKEAIIYELHVRAFHDSNGDGIGDFPGLTRKLDYLHELGITALWLLPFYPSPLRDDGYDIAEYRSINPIYGTLKDFKEFLTEAHARGIYVITELVVNHTSDQHPWFQRARRAKKGTPERDFYVWNDSPDKYKDARIIFKDFEHSNWTYDPVARAYYWHRFYSHQPDLNFENQRVCREVESTLDFWFEMGVDGLRLDAVPYIFEREGTNCENLPETHAYLKTLRKHVDSKHKNKMLLAEANQWPEDAVAYFGDGDECHMNFHFPLMPRMFMAIRMENSYPIIDILDQTPEIPDNCSWAIFLRNHDELTLEMVTDEERDYMYRMYAAETRARINLGIRRRLAPLLENDRRKIELLNALLFSLPGTPVIYYGDEIGMGDNIYLGDRDAVRTPFQWSADRNAGFSRANPQKLFLPVIIDPEYHFESVNVEAQNNNPSSLLWWMKRIVGLRKQHRALHEGELEFIYPENRKMLVFLRRYDDEKILVVANLSRHVQYVELDLEKFEGLVPMELFGHTRFPPIGELPYFLTLAPYSFYWFELTSEEEENGDAEFKPPLLENVRSIRDFFPARKPGVVQNEIVPNWLRHARWFAGKNRRITGISIIESIILSEAHGGLLSLLVQVEYTEGESEIYQVLLTRSYEDQADEILEEHPRSVLARLNTPGEKEPIGILHDALVAPRTAEFLLDIIKKRRRFKGEQGHLSGAPEKAFRRIEKEKAEAGDDISDEPDILRGEQSNTSIAYGEKFILKFFRRLEEGTNPDLEIGKYFQDRTRFRYVPSVAGSIEYEGSRSMSLGILHEYRDNQGDAWNLTLDSISHFYDNIVAFATGSDETPDVPELRFIDMRAYEPPEIVAEAIGTFPITVELLGQRTAEMHLALAAHPEHPGFEQEPFSSHYQRGLYQSLRNLMDEAFSQLRNGLHKRGLPGHVRRLAETVLNLSDEAHYLFSALTRTKYETMRIRTHGDYHLGQVLYTGRDFVILDFEGEPLRSISERRLVRSALKDVAGMIRSFHYASRTVLFDRSLGGNYWDWSNLWYRVVASRFLQSYLATARRASFLPRNKDHIQELLDIFLLEKALYELKYEMGNRPDWVRIPLQGIRELLAGGGGKD